jgi:protein-tyrosine phosphatase
MVELARRHGTVVLAATPHASPAYPYKLDETERLLGELRKKAPPGIRLIRGCDFHLTFTNVESALRSPQDFAIDGRCWLLMELSELTVFSNTDALWARLEEAGLRIILTHPERNALLRQRIDVIERWVRSGRLMQITAGSLLGHFGRAAQEFSIRLLDAGLAHIVASDAHGLHGRQPRLDEAYAWLKSRYSEEFATRLTVTHPRAVVEGRMPDLSGFHAPGRKGSGSWWRRLWRIRSVKRNPAEDR